ncbi:MAG: VWA domain-containing protein [Pirellulales bacterium]
MSSWRITFAEPYWLLLLLLLPLLWWFSLESLSGLGRYRRWIALALRSLCVLLIVLALAGAETQLTSDRVTVVYLLDQSESIPTTQREAMVSYVLREVEAHRDDQRRDRAAVVVFGRNASVEVAPLEGNLPILYNQLESTADLRTDATNLAGAMRLAQGIFPEGTSRRIVLVTDGNENVGDSQSLAELLAREGVGLDVIPVPLGTSGEVSIERVILPPDIRQGQPFEGRVVVNYAAEDANSPPARGKLVVSRRTGRNSETLSEQDVELAPGKRVFTFLNEINEPDFYEYDAQFVPADASFDALPQNNRSTSFTQVLGKGHILLIEDWENPGNFDFLVQRLRQEGLQVTVQPSNDLFTSLGELQRYDSILLADVPRTSGSEGVGDSVTSFSDDQVAMLVRNTQEMGCGLVMLGGPNSFGAGGWANTELEKAMPVDFQINNAEVVPVSALAMVMHASEIPQGNHWQKVIAVEALKLLGPQDYCGVIHWNGTEQWMWSEPVGMAKVGPNRKMMMARVGRMTPGDMPDFDPALKLAASSFSKLKDAAIKHMIVISDGDPSDATSGALTALKNLNVQVTTVAVGAHGAPETRRLQAIARATNGKFYVANNPKALPKIYQREVRRIARPLVKEQEGMQAIRVAQHEILAGIDALPAYDGFVLTSVKSNPLVQVILQSPVPAERENSTLLACWTYDAGRTAVLTTDAGHRWASRWTGWDGYDKLFSQLVRWSMRPTGDQGNIAVTTDLADGKVHVVVSALDDEDRPQSFLNMSAAAVGPDMKARDLDLRQTGPGRYEGEMEAEASGNYFLTIQPGGQRAPIRTGVSVPYSSEYRDRQTNVALLENLSSVRPAGGEKGQLYEPLNGAAVDQLVEKRNTFRRDLPKSISAREIWPYLALICGCLFFADVFVRRVAIGWEWLTPVWQAFQRTVLRREPAEAVPDQRLARLRARKETLERDLDQQRAATRFEPTPDQLPSTDELDQAVRGADRPAGPAGTAQNLTPTEQEEEDYTARLLKAKRKAKRDIPRSDDQPPS